MSQYLMKKRKNTIKYITSGALSRPAGAFWPNNLIKINKIGHIIHPKRKEKETNVKGAYLKIYAVNGYGNAELLRQVLDKMMK